MRAWGVLAVAAMVVFWAVPLRAQADGGAWSRLSQLAPGQAIKVDLNHGHALQGGFERASEDALVVSVSGTETSLAKADVARVEEARGGHRKRHALIGAGLGVVAGLGYCAAAGNSIIGCRDTTPRAKGWLVSVGFFGAVGAIVGALIPGRGWQELYRAP
ncbi:MAG: hypothetical protein ACRD1E_11060, partial [Terriglobales bacterium]